MLLDSQIEAWLAEDIGHRDVTNDIPGETTGKLVVTEAGVVAGLEAAAAVFEYLDVTVVERASNGSSVSPGDAVLVVEGPARAVLRGERTAVNLVSHLSGVASETAKAVERAAEQDPSVRIAGTRKTTPGLRGLEKRAIAAGGGDTHRLDLSQLVMVKDNHIAELGLERAVDRLRERASFATKIEVEVESLAELDQAVAAGADVVMLDNAAPSTCEEAATRLADEDVLLEASGGIQLADVATYAATGVDIISMGSLTHSAPALDCSFTTG